MRRKSLGCSVAVVLSVAGVASGNGVFLNFQDLPLGSTYNYLDTFTTSGVTITVDEFQWSNGTWTTAGFARVENGGMAGGIGKEINTNNVNLDFGFGPLTGLDLRYGEYGGNINIEINGDFYNVENYANLPSSIGGVTVSVTDFGTPGNGTGILSLSGPINSFSLGGQENYIDNIKAVPEPVTLLLVGLGGLGLLRRTRP